MIQILLILFVAYSNAKADVVDLVLADSLIKQGNCAEAATHYSRYLETAYSALAESNLAVAQYCIGKKEEAYNAAYRAYQNNNTEPVIKYNLALMYIDRSDFRSSFDLLSSIEPASLPAEKKSNYYSLQCWNTFKIGTIEKALELCKLANNDLKNPTCNSQYRYGRVLFALEDITAAQPLFKYVFENCPGNESAYYYALTLYRMGDKRTAYNILKKFSDSSSNKDLFYLVKGEIDNGRDPK